MTFTASSGRIEVKSPSGDVVFDSDDRLFFASNFLAGSVVRPARATSYWRNSVGQESWVPIDLTETVDLADIHGSANAVVGAFKVTGTLAVPGTASQDQAANGVRNYGWFTAGGTYVHACMPRWSFSGSWQILPMGLLSLYTFTASGGKLRLSERTQGNPGFVATGYVGSINLSQEEITIDYKLFAGTYV